MRRKARIDGNQREIDALARQVGALVIDMTKSPEIGFDRLYLWQGKVYVVEVKDGSLPPSKQKLTAREENRMLEIERHGVNYNIIHSKYELLQMFGLVTALPQQNNRRSL